MSQTARHALVRNLHQPPGTLQALLTERPWEAREILCAMDRMPRRLRGHEDVARVHLSISGTALETLSDPEFQARACGIVDTGALLRRLPRGETSCHFYWGEACIPKAEQGLDVAEHHLHRARQAQD